MSALPGGILVLAFAAHSGVVAKPGQITGLSANPATAAVGTNVTLTIAGSETCGELTITFGDGNSTTLAGVALPHILVHAYGKTGSYTPSVTGGGPAKHCTGAGTASLKVMTYVELLCGAVDCGAVASALDGRQNPGSLSPSVAAALADAVPDACPHAPQITGMLLGSLIEPGGPVILFGCGFVNPEVRLLGQFPGGYVTLKPDKWTGKGFAGWIPDGITGVPDHEAALQVVTNAGSSNEWKVQFTADRAIHTLTLHEVTADCDNGDWTEDHCPRSDCNVSLCAVHQLNVPGAASGSDQVWANLKNGWTDYKHGFTQYWEGLTEGSNAAGSYVGSDVRPTMKVDWHVSGWSYISYRVKFKIIGPVGVPYR